MLVVENLPLRELLRLLLEVSLDYLIHHAFFAKLQELFTRRLSKSDVLPFHLSCELIEFSLSSVGLIWSALSVRVLCRLFIAKLGSS